MSVCYFYVVTAALCHGDVRHKIKKVFDDDGMLHINGSLYWHWHTCLCTCDTDYKITMSELLLLKSRMIPSNVMITSS